MTDPSMFSLARMLGLTPEALESLSALSPKYMTFRVPKPNGGDRIICAPVPELKVIQRKLLDRLLVHFPVSNDVFGGVKGRDHVLHARQHILAKSTFIVDLKDAFTHGTPERVTTALKDLACPFDAVSTIVALTTDPVLGLPQGAPTSNALFSLICTELDACCAQYALEQDLCYTRYVDELVFSSATDIPIEMRDRIVRMIQELDFRVNPRKLRFFLARHGAITVTGINISPDGLGLRVHLSKKKRERLRSFFHRALTDPTITRSMLEGAMSEVCHVYGCCHRVPKRIGEAYDSASRAVKARKPPYGGRLTVPWL